MMKHNSFSVINILNFLFVGLLVFSLLFLRSWHLIGPISVRNISAILILIIAFFKKPHKSITKVESIYLCWIGLYVLLCLSSGILFSPVIYKNLIGYHFIAVILIFSIPRLINEISIVRICLFWFALFYLFNCIISWLQYNNDPIGWLIGNFISPMNEERMDRVDNMESVENMLSISICGGINGFVVTNGQFLACFMPLATILLWVKDKWKSLLGLLFYCISIYIVFCVQQRMSLIISVLYFCIFFFIKSSTNQKVSFFLLLLICYLYLQESISIDIDLFGRIFTKEDDIRSSTIDYLWQFISSPNNLICGNPQPLTDQDPLTLALSHNCILDSLRRCGIFGLLIFLYLYTMMMKECYIIFKKAIRLQDKYTIVFSLSCMFFLLYSLTHSSGLPSGDVFTWIAYTIMLQCYRLCCLPEKRCQEMTMASI